MIWLVIVCGVCMVGLCSVAWQSYRAALVATFGVGVFAVLILVALMISVTRPDPGPTPKPAPTVSLTVSQP